jgi:NADH:ubiquinone oxidoreductase subunit F (NADH-binding)
VHHQPGRFVSGEIRALLEGLDGRPAVPPARRSLPSVRGLHGAPTFASNAETFAQVALLVMLGPTRYAEVGAPEEPGTTLLTMAGDVPHAGVLEVPTGLPLVALTGGGYGPLLVGGYHGRWVDDLGDLTVSRPALRARGLPLNAGVLARLPADACALAEVAAVSTWLAEQSVGQCGPCLFGVTSVAQGVVDLLHGHAAPHVAQRLQGLAGRGACAHPDGTAAFVGTALSTLADEVARHLEHGRCGRPYRGVLPVREGGRP